MLKINLANVLIKTDFDSYTKRVAIINKQINDKRGAGNDYLGWADYPLNYSREEVQSIKRHARYVKENFDVLVVCGIGGSYLGTRAAIEAINGLKNTDRPEIIFMGQTFSSDYVSQVMKYLKGKRFAINVISKSGTTTETSISFRLLKELLEKQVGKEKAKKAIFATTDTKHGALRELANKEKYTTFALPGDIGGRYSVLTAVGLFPIACAGINIDEMLSGAFEAYKLYNNPDLSNNPCYRYAVVRDMLYRNRFAVELFVTYEPQFAQFSEWLKQLFGESEGKEHKGLFPGSVTFSTDLHSLGQFIQDGSPILFETVIFVKKPACNIKIPHDEKDLDGLNYLEGKTLSYVNEKAFQGTLDAHVKNGKVNNVVIEIDKLTPKSLGHLFYFFERACAMSAYLLNVNPFDQPGVEIYKKNMFHLLGKKGY